MEHVMKDLETMGTRAGCAVVSIGAVMFNPKTGELGAEFYGVAVADQGVYGLFQEPGTKKWWSEQSEEARKVFTDPAAMRLPLLLASYTAWLGTVTDPDTVKVWGNGASFDQPILTAAYAAIGAPQPWKFWNDRCYRTVKNLAPHVKLKREGTYHNALDDAKSQAQHLMDIVANTTLTLA